MSPIRFIQIALVEEGAQPPLLFSGTGGLGIISGIGVAGRMPISVE
jgi:hypothetical protein